jgi:hypothetical protein
MQLHAALLVLLAVGALAATVPQQQPQASIEATASNYPRTVSPEVRTTIDSVIAALGSNDTATPKLAYNPNPPEQGSAVKVNATLSAPWHSIARPKNTNCAVRIKLITPLPPLCLSQQSRYTMSGLHGMPLHQSIPCPEITNIALCMISSSPTVCRCL